MAHHLMKAQGVTKADKHTRFKTHTHTHTLYIYIYIYTHKHTHKHAHKLHATAHTTLTHTLIRNHIHRKNTSILVMGLMETKKMINQ